MTTCSLSLYPRETSCHSHQRTLAKDFSAKGILTMPPRTLVLLSGPCPASARGCPNCGCFQANPWTTFVRGLGARNTRAANRFNALITRGVNYSCCSYSIFHSIPKIFLFLAFQVTKRVGGLIFGRISARKSPEKSRLPPPNLKYIVPGST